MKTAKERAEQSKEMSTYCSTLITTFNRTQKSKQRLYFKINPPGINLLACFIIHMKSKCKSSLGDEAQMEMRSIKLETLNTV